MRKTGKIRSLSGQPKRNGGRHQTVKWLSKDECRRFFRAIPRDRVRDRLLFNVIYLHGLRRGEAAILRVEDLRHGRIYVTRLKGGQSKAYPMFPSTKALLRRYLELRRDDACPYLFRGRRRNCTPLSGRTIAALFQRYAAKAGLPSERQHPHVLRHSIGTHMAEAGFDISDVADHLGHADLSSTEIYFQITDRRRAKSHRRMRRSREIVQHT